MKLDSLAQFDKKLMDGLLFCKRVYDLFEGIRKSKYGPKKLRLRKSRVEKKLIEELLPIAWFVQSEYRYGRIKKVKLVDGSQNYDAYVLSSGPFVDLALTPKRVFVEATLAVHQNDYLQREHLTENGVAHGVRGMSRDKKTGKTVSNPMVIGGMQPEIEFIRLICQRIKDKAAKNYPDDTVLVIQCQFDTVFIGGGMEYVAKGVNKAKLAHPFREIYLVDSSHEKSAKLEKAPVDK